jgi:hypothetical protein
VLAKDEAVVEDVEEVAGVEAKHRRKVQVAVFVKDEAAMLKLMMKVSTKAQKVALHVTDHHCLEGDGEADEMSGEDDHASGPATASRGKHESLFLDNTEGEIAVDDDKSGTPIHKQETRPQGPRWDCSRPLEEDHDASVNMI